jgi:hypothetical protein
VSLRDEVAALPSWRADSENPQVVYVLLEDVLAVIDRKGIEYGLPGYAKPSEERPAREALRTKLTHRDIRYSATIEKVVVLGIEAIIEAIEENTAAVKARNP